MEKEHDLENLTSFFCVFIIVFIWACYRSKNVELSNSTPSLSISLGIFFTFFGIAFSLSNIEANSSSADAFTDLLLGLKTAFWTSVFGLFVSIVCKFNLARKAKNFDPHNEINEQTRKIVNAITTSSQTSVKILSDNLVTEFKETSSTFQSDINETMNSFNTSISKMMEQSDSLCKKSNTTLKNSIEAIDYISIKSGDNLQRVHQFTKAMLEQLDVLMLKVNDTIDINQDRLIEFSSNLSLSHEQTKKVNDLFNLQISTTQSQYNELLKSSKNVNDSITNIGQLIKDLENANEFVKVEFKDDLSATFTDFKRQYNSMTKAFDEQHLKQLSDIGKLFNRLDETVFKGMDAVVTSFSKGVLELFDTTNLDDDEVSQIKEQILSESKTDKFLCEEA